MKSFEEQLEAETTAWVGDGVITVDQRNRILARHPARTKEVNRFLAVLATIGGALLVVGVSLVIKSNWERINDWVKIGGLVALLVGAYAAGWRLKVAPGNYPRTGDSLLMLGAVLFLLGIALVSQIFHLESRPPSGVLLWWAGIVAMPWLARAKGMQFVSAVAGLTWIMMELGSADSWVRLALDRGNQYDREFLLFGAASFFLGLALTFLGMGLRGGRHADFAGLHEKLGLIVAASGLYLIGFSWSAQDWHYQPMYPARSEATAFLVALAALGAAWAWWRNRAETSSIGLYLFLGLVPASATLLGIDLHDSGWLCGGLACAAMFLLNLGMIRMGLATGRESWINLGMAGLALNIVTRYFLLFGTMLEGGVFFIVTGLLVLGLGWYLERKRRKLVGALRRGSLP